MAGNFNSTILVAPLDWGLGHSTRCIPLINYLLCLNCKVIIAAEGAQEKLLKQEFPHLQFVHLPGYRISYTNKERFFGVKVLMQVPKILQAIKSENKWLNNFVKTNKVDAIISDNRYGLNHQVIPSVFITHQLTIKAPFAFAEKLLRFFNFRLISKFKECWVPDYEGSINLAGDLSHPRKLPSIPTKYLGGISRFTKKPDTIKEIHLLVVISGPEPQRSLLEEKLLKELRSYNKNVLFVRGLPGNNEPLQSFNKVTVINHLSAVELEEAFNKAEYIISRTGYTTVMDICKLKSKAILIPTPGQTEQEYLARHLNKQGWCLTFTQRNFSLAEALEKAKTFPFNIPDLEMDAYKNVLKEFVSRL